MEEEERQGRNRPAQPAGAGAAPQTAYGFVLLPPAPDSCPVCAGGHAPEDPHNPNSLYWQVVFSGQHDRYPTWVDAMAHCSASTQRNLTRALLALGISPADEYSASLAGAAFRRGGRGEEGRHGTGG